MKAFLCRGFLPPFNSLLIYIVCAIDFRGLEIPSQTIIVISAFVLDTKLFDFIGSVCICVVWILIEC